MVAPVETRHDRLKRELQELMRRHDCESGALVLLYDGEGDEPHATTVHLIRDKKDAKNVAKVLVGLAEVFVRGATS